MSEDEILKLFCDSLGGINWAKNDNWQTSASYCTWYGVECNDDGSAEAIVMINNTLAGSFPTEI